jgi:hypothetical protein
MLLVIGLAAGGAACGGDSPTPGTLRDLDGLVFNHAYKCSQTDPPPKGAWCADPSGMEKIVFKSSGANSYDVRDVPDHGFQMSGTVSGLTLTWTATSPNGYSEGGSWTFSADGSTFAGHSTYHALDLSYSGACEGTGAVDPGTPATPASVGECP